MDGEDMGDHVVVFDLLELNNIDMRSLPAVDRHAKLQAIFSGANPSSCMRCIDSFSGTDAKIALYNRVKARKGEGLVFKLAASPYEPNRPSSGGTQLKLKFVEIATCMVLSHNEGKRSVAIGLYDQNSSLTSVGNVAVPQNKAFPAPGTLLDVEYLYAFEASNALFQPVFKRPRTDLPPADILTSAGLHQLKFKPRSPDQFDNCESDDEDHSQDAIVQPKRDRMRA
jgi:bifunctional non-homologous end joining protein LigD